MRHASLRFFASRPSLLSLAAVAAVVLLDGCSSDSDILLLDVTEATFVETIDNPYLPLEPGALRVYEADTPDGHERIAVAVLNEPRDVNGIEAVQVRTAVTIDDELLEDTVDLYAQDVEGNVWFLGKETCELAEDECVSREGSWRYGIDGALPGLAMLANPALDGERYYQALAPGVAEEVAEVVALPGSVTVDGVTFEDCVQTRTTSPLVRDLDETKTWCRGVGLVFVEQADVGEELTELRDPPLLPDVEDATFVRRIDNHWLPLVPGTVSVYQADTEEGRERIEVTVLKTTRDVNGIAATEVRDVVTIDGEIREDTIDFFAQDTEGNVWYLGEETCEFEDGVCVDTAGSWRYGVDGALPGLAMPAVPTVNGQRYFQEFYVGEAEDVGEVVGVGGSVTVPAGTFTDCVETHDTSALRPEITENKHYCRNVGLVLTEEPDAREELTSFTRR